MRALGSIDYLPNAKLTLRQVRKTASSAMLRQDQALHLVVLWVLPSSESR